MANAELPETVKSAHREALSDETLQFKDAQIRYLLDRVVGLNARVRLTEEKVALLEAQLADTTSETETPEPDPAEKPRT